MSPENQNPIQEKYDKDLGPDFDPLKKAEEKGTAGGLGGGKKSVASNISGIGGVKNAEKNAGGGYINNFTGAGGTAGAMKPGGLMASVKKQSPMLTIILTIVGLIGGVAMFGGSSLMPMSILANMVQKLNGGQETSLTIRTNKMFASRLANNYTTGSCTIVKVFCRFTRPSNRFLSQLEKNGIQLMDKKGNIIKASKWLPNTRPTKYVYFNSKGDAITVTASKLKSELRKNPEFMARFYNATKTRFMSLNDSIFASIKARFGFNLNDRLKTVTDEKGVTSEADTLSAAEDKGAKAAADAVDAGDAGAEAEAERIARSFISDEAADIAKKLGKAGKGDAVGIVAGATCLVADGPGIVVKANRAFQMAQLIKYSVVFLSAFGAIKAGDASPAEAGAVLGSLTKVVKGKSAMDSFGMRYVMTGDTKPKKTDKYKNFSPGSSMIAKLGGIRALTNSRAKISTCNVLTNPVTGQAINVALATNAVDTLGTSLIAAGINIAVGYLLGTAIEKLAPPLIDFAIKHSPISMASILKYFFGDLTQNLSGEGVGDALTSGAAHVMGQTANAGGNMPLTVPQAVAYDNATKQVQLAYAQQDRATKSPLDASSPNTFLGSIVQRLTPYFTSSGSTLGSFSNTFSSISNMVMGSFGLALNPLAVSAASNAGDEYKLCDDPEITDNGIAAGPFCNIIYGVPPKYLDKDPVDVMNKLIASGDIDENTGEPIDKGGSEMSLMTWMELCTDGTTDQANNCKIDDKTADFALYTIDHRIQKSMDEEATTAPATVGSTAPADTTTSSNNNLFILGGSIACLMKNPDIGNIEVTYPAAGWNLVDNCEGGRNFAGALTVAKLPGVTQDIKNANVIVIPLGANNLSDIDEATSPRSGAVFTGHMKELYDYLHSINPTAEYYWVNYGLAGFSPQFQVDNAASKLRRMKYINKLIGRFANQNNIKVVDWAGESSTRDYTPNGGIHPSRPDGMKRYSRFLLSKIETPSP